jgi:DNA topoisomerase-1
MVRLIHASRDALTITRQRRGRGFCFVDREGAVLTGEARACCVALGIPPAWTEVRIAHDARAHIQAMGQDAAGRTQYIYHPAWEERRVARKQRQLSTLATALPAVRRRVSRDLAAPAGSQELAIAIAVALIDRTAMRIGREQYLRSSGTRGAGTLYAGDVKVRGRRIALRFPAKSGRESRYEIADRRLAAAIARIKPLTGRRLLVFRDDAGKLKPVTGEMINAYLAEAAHAHVTAKDFRTLHASAMAAEELAAMEPARSPSGRKRQIAAVTRKVAEFLHNTPAISRKSYVAPCLFRLFDDGTLNYLWKESRGAPSNGLRRAEQRLGEVLAAVS